MERLSTGRRSIVHRMMLPVWMTQRMTAQIKGLNMAIKVPVELR